MQVGRGQGAGGTGGIGGLAQLGQVILRGGEQASALGKVRQRVEQLHVSG